MITAQLLISVGVTSKLANLYITSLNDTMAKYGITTPLRERHFLAQVLHESAMLVYNKEIGAGHAYDVGRLAVQLGNTPEDDGDGEKYKGRGFIEITGTDNYRQISHDLGVDFLTHPELLEHIPYCATSAGWFWDKHHLNQFADADDIHTLTKLINGGYKGLAERMALLNKLTAAIK